MRVRPDDEVYRINTVWLGPRGLTFPWTARYLAYGVWLLTFLVVLFVEAVTPLSIGIPPVWEICLTTLFTYAVMGMVDHERPVRSVVQTLIAEVGTPRAERGTSVVVSSRRLKVVAQRPARAGRRHGGGSPGKPGARVKPGSDPRPLPAGPVRNQSAQNQSVRNQSLRNQSLRNQDGRNPAGQAVRAAPGQSIRRPDLRTSRPGPNRSAQHVPGQREATARQVARPTAEPLSGSHRDDGDEGTSLNPRGTS